MLLIDRIDYTNDFWDEVVEVVERGMGAGRGGTGGKNVSKRCHRASSMLDIENG